MTGGLRVVGFGSGRCKKIVNPKPSAWNMDTYLEVHISGVIIKVTIVITHIQGLITLLVTTHEPPSRPDGSSPEPLGPYLLQADCNFLSRGYPKVRSKDSLSCVYAFNFFDCLHRTRRLSRNQVLQGYYEVT